MPTFMVKSFRYDTVEETWKYKLDLPCPYNYHQDKHGNWVELVFEPINKESEADEEFLQKLCIEEFEVATVYASGEHDFHTHIFIKHEVDSAKVHETMKQKVQYEGPIHAENPYVQWRDARYMSATMPEPSGAASGAERRQMPEPSGAASGAERRQMTREERNNVRLVESHEAKRSRLSIKTEEGLD